MRTYEITLKGKTEPGVLNRLKTAIDSYLRTEAGRSGAAIRIENYQVKFGKDRLTVVCLSDIDDPILSVLKQFKASQRKAFHEMQIGPGSVDEHPKYAELSEQHEQLQAAHKQLSTESQREYAQLRTQFEEANKALFGANQALATKDLEISGITAKCEDLNGQIRNLETRLQETPINPNLQDTQSLVFVYQTSATPATLHEALESNNRLVQEAITKHEQANHQLLLDIYQQAVQLLQTREYESTSVILARMYKQEKDNPATREVLKQFEREGLLKISEKEAEDLLAAYKEEQIPVYLVKAKDGDTYVYFPLKNNAVGGQVAQDLVGKLQMFSREARARLRISCSEVKETPYFTLKFSNKVDLPTIIETIPREVKDITQKAELKLYFVPIEQAPNFLVEQRITPSEVTMPTIFTEFAKQRIKEFGFDETKDFQAEKLPGVCLSAVYNTLRGDNLPRVKKIIALWAKALDTDEEHINKLVKQERLLKKANPLNS